MYGSSAMKNPLNKVFSPNRSRDYITNVFYAPIDKIIPSPYQPREIFDHDTIMKLGESISEFGLIQPLVVTQRKQGFYELIAGERRLRACKAIGLEKVPVVLREASEEEKAEMTLVENLQRQDLNFMEEALGYKQILHLFSLTQEELAQRIGKSQSTIANKLRILKLPDSVLNRLRDTQVIASLTERHARALLLLKEEDLMISALDSIIEKGLTVRETEELIKNLINNDKKGDHKEKKDGRMIKIFKDLRLSLNSIKKTVKEIKEAGYGIEMEEVERSDCIEVKIKLSKKGLEGGG